jgi:hypothetical protein
MMLCMRSCTKDVTCCWRASYQPPISRSIHGSLVQYLNFPVVPLTPLRPPARLSVSQDRRDLDRAQLQGRIVKRDLKLSRLCMSPADWYLWLPRRGHWAVEARYVRLSFSVQPQQGNQLSWAWSWPCCWVRNPPHQSAGRRICGRNKVRAPPKQW